MAFDETLFPTDISFGSRGGPVFNTSVVTVDSGFESREPNWDDPLFEFNTRYGVKRFSQLQTLMELFIVQNGMHRGFRYKNFLDFEAVNQPMSFIDVVVNGAALESRFQLNRNYADLIRPFTKSITKPAAGTVTVRESASSANFTIDLITGIVNVTDYALTIFNCSHTNPSDPTTVTCPVNHNLLVGDHVYLFNSGLGRIDGPQIVFSVPTPTTFVVEDDAGIIGSIVMEVRIPFQGQNPTYAGTFDWSGEYQLPVRFNSDEFAVTLTEGDLGDVSDIPLREIKDFQ